MTATNSTMATIQPAELTESLADCTDLVCTDALWARIKAEIPGGPSRLLAIAVHTRPTDAECAMLARWLAIQGDRRRVVHLVEP